MSTVIVVTPLIIAHWPAITAAVVAAVGTMGFAVTSGAANAVRSAQRSAGRTRAEIELEESEVLAEGGGFTEEMVVERDGVRGVFSRDARGALKLCMEGEGVSKAELKRLGEELIGRVTQQFVYHRVMTELKERGMPVVDQEVDADRTVRIRVRNVSG